MADKALVVEESRESRIQESSTGRTTSGAIVRTLADGSTRSENRVAASSSTSVRNSLANFTEAAAKVMNQFGPLGKWIKEQITQQRSQIAAALDLPKLYEEFIALSPIMKMLVVIGILGLLCLLGWMTWNAVGYIWPHIQKFINSSAGQKLIANAAGFLDSLAKSGVVTSFSTVFSAAANEQKNKAKAVKAVDDDSSDDDLNEKKKQSTSLVPSSPCFELEQYNGLNKEANFSMIVLEIIQSFFTSLGASTGFKI